MVELRREYRDRMGELEDVALEMGARVVDMLDEVMDALDARDLDRAAAVIRADDEVDALYRRLEHGILGVLALQAPVAGELRLVAGLLHANMHLERMGDLCVNIAKFIKLVQDFPADPALMGQVQEMGVHARRLMQECLEAFRRRDLEAVRRLPVLDEPLDRLNKGLFRRLVELASDDESRLDWAMRMVLVARYLERLGDHAVDIGEQVIFIVTGELEELASNSPQP